MALFPHTVPESFGYTIIAQAGEDLKCGDLVVIEDGKAFKAEFPYKTP